ncbi:MAG TPA: hypothetical protein VHH36_04720 [Candidatus Thermoplasmatota archaeon]|nr:hypothetical protein [Candidatus Thermoplasmatota archaeon]
MPWLRPLSAWRGLGRRLADARLLAVALLGVLSAALFAYVGAANLRRDAHDAPARRALRQFALWWLGLALYTLQGAATSLLVAAGVTHLGAHVALLALGYVPLMVALWGLLSYLVYIHAGTHRLQPLLKAYHVALGAGLVLLLARTRPTAVVASGWGTQVAYAHPLALLVFAILGPVLASAVAYGALYRKTPDPAARRRIRLVSASLVLWFGLSIAAGAQVVSADWWPLAARLLALGASLLLLRAFAPGALTGRAPAAAAR